MSTVAIVVLTICNVDGKKTNDANYGWILQAVSQLSQSPSAPVTFLFRRLCRLFDRAHLSVPARLQKSSRAHFKVQYAVFLRSTAEYY